MHPLFIFVGLGNPGDTYEKTRHNIGFAAIDIIKKTKNFEAFHSKKNVLCEISEGSIEGQKIILAKPTTFMNLSGNAVHALLTFYKCKPEQCVVLYDDIDLPVGTIRIRASGSSGTHNGMRSICSSIGNNFPRIRIGIETRTPEQKIHQDLAEYVLGRFNKVQLETINDLLIRIPSVIDTLVLLGIEKTMEKFN